MSNIYLNVIIEKNWRLKTSFSKFKKYVTMSNSHRYHRVLKLLVADQKPELFKFKESMRFVEKKKKFLI